jgi:hypothetical protein
MKYVQFARFLPNGKYHNVGIVPPTSDTLLEADVYIGVVDPDTQYHGPGGKPVSMPPRPSPFAEFNYDTKSWEVDHAVAWGKVRSQRQHLLERSDWAALPDVPASTRQKWLSYRQALRDITQQADPLNIVWPTPPEA